MPRILEEWIGAILSWAFQFPPGVRPVPLEIQHLRPLNIANFEARMQAMTKPTYTAIVPDSQRNGGKPAIVLCSYKKACTTYCCGILMTYSSVEQWNERPISMFGEYPCPHTWWWLLGNASSTPFRQLKESGVHSFAMHHEKNSTRSFLLFEAFPVESHSLQHYLHDNLECLRWFLE
nr:DExH-box ATP-dependent RNA helicase DExH12-like [Ipomoea batatas]